MALAERHSLTKTRPAADGYTGVLLLEALAPYIPDGVRVRVDRPWASLPNEYIVCERPGYARVWAHCVAAPEARTPDGYRFSDHYDIPAGVLWAVAATVTDEENTRFVYDGFSAPEGMSARGQARDFARAVAVQLGVEPFCGSCEDYGQVQIFHASTDALIGHRPCEWAPCVERRAKARAKYEAGQERKRSEEVAHDAVCTGTDCCPPF